MKGQFQINGLGRCLVGTYALRGLTKHFSCSPQDLLFLAAKEGMSLEFTSYLLKYTYENGQIQEKGAGKYEIKAVEDIDLFLDTNTIDSKEYEAMYDALWLSITGVTYKEYVAKLEEADKREIQSEEEKKSLTMQHFGESLTSTVVEQV